MGKVIRNDIEYDVTIDSHRIQPLFRINNYIMGVGIWMDELKNDYESRLMEAIECYEYHKERNTLDDSYLHVHNPKPNPEPKTKVKVLFLSDISRKIKFKGNPKSVEGCIIRERHNKLKNRILWKFKKKEE